jgi:tRNA (mo5U34)-methyltransferase
VAGPGPAAFRRLSVYDVAALGERFDLVLFLGVLYHLRHPLLALDRIHAHVSRDLLCVQSMQRGAAPGYPRLHFVEHRYSGDETNWWIPNRACTEAMLRSAGYELIAHPEEEVYVCRHREERHG